MINKELSKNAEKFEALLTQHKISFKEFNELLQMILQYSELIQQWDLLPVMTKIEIGRYHGDNIPKELEDKLLEEERQVKKGLK